MASKKRRPAADPGRVKTTAELDSGDGPTAAQLSRRGGRETVDALVVAFVLAFLIRTFEAEAFVIPTGSMAPTLMGRHKDVFCEQCGTRYKVNSSDDTEDYLAAWTREKARVDAERAEFEKRAQSGRLSRDQVEYGRRQFQEFERRLGAQGDRIKQQQCVGGECPQCRYLMPLSNNIPASYQPEWQEEANQTANYSGDRLVVSKYAYSFSDPERWDVAVFKYPGNSQTNYIKRVTGLPGEEIRIFQGDLFVRPLGTEDDFEIVRKPPEVLLAMKQFVHDTHHEARNLIDAGWPLGWSGDDGWATEKATETSTKDAPVYQATYHGESTDGETHWLRYHHRPPGEPVWRRVLVDQEEIGVSLPPELITDFTPYNTRLNLEQVEELKQFSLAPRPQRTDDLGRIGIHWVGDLILEADLTVESESGEVSLDLVEAGVHYGVTFDVATGAASLWRRPFEGTEREELATAKTSVRGKGSHAVRLANVDNRLLLWVDGNLLDADASYTDEASDAYGEAEVPRTSDADEGDLAPAGVGVRGGAVEVDRLRLWRDGYYIARTNGDEPRWVLTTDLPPNELGMSLGEWEATIQDLPGSPDLWGSLASRRYADFKVDDGQLFVMGDNSGWSSDARLWAGGNGPDGGQPGGPYLERKQLVGKAICVYWPHSWYSLPFTGRRVPAWPNVSDMRLVR